LRLGLEELDLEPEDPRPARLEHREVEPVVADLVAGLRGAAEVAEDVPADGVEVLVVETRAELLVEVVDRERPGDADPLLVDPLDRLVGEVELVLDVAEDVL
jgi:hypothetical protein